LRLTDGVDWSRLSRNHGGDDMSGYEDSLHELSDKGLVEWKDSIVRLTPSGMLLSNEIFQLFV